VKNLIRVDRYMQRMIETAKHKIKSSRAFTMAEALVAMLILLMVSVIVATGIPAAMRAYNNVVLASNAEVLLSTTMTALRNELGMATDIRVIEKVTTEEDGKTNVTDKIVESDENGVAAGEAVIYYNEATGSESEIFLKTSGDITDIMYKSYAADPLLNNKVSKNERRIVTKEAADKDKDLHVKYSGVSYDKSKGVFTFTGLAVTKGDGSDTLAAIKNDDKSAGNYSIRIITDHTED
jgi:type II secretory pathway pseudopilin PulG